MASGDFHPFEDSDKPNSSLETSTIHQPSSDSFSCRSLLSGWQDKLPRVNSGLLSSLTTHGATCPSPRLSAGTNIMRGKATRPLSDAMRCIDSTRQPYHRAESRRYVLSNFQTSLSGKRSHGTCPAGSPNPIFFSDIIATLRIFFSSLSISSRSRAGSYDVFSSHNQMPTSASFPLPL